MKYVAYIVAAILLTGWLIGIFLFEVSSVFHTLPVIALVIILMRVIQGNMSMKNYSKHSEF